MTDTYRADRLRVLGPDGAFVAFAKDEDAAKLLVQALNGEDVTVTPEPDPWPTADYVWGTVESDGGESDGPTLWLRRPSGAYESVESYADSRSNRFTLVVPVTVVPTERVDYLSAAHASWVAGAIDDKTMIGYAIGLLESLDELGLDQ